ncbi:MAG: hypothetical protein H6R01_783 [Burkholderiaceae bacterium]|nr:hypothetical protein [Burkholderiaceae bacterium]
MNLRQSGVCFAVLFFQLGCAWADAVIARQEKNAEGYFWCVRSGREAAKQCVQEKCEKLTGQACKTVMSSSKRGWHAVARHSNGKKSGGVASFGNPTELQAIDEAFAKCVHKAPDGDCQVVLSFEDNTPLSVAAELPEE